MNEQSNVGGTVTRAEDNAQNTLSVMQAFQRKHQAAESARKAVDAAWARYCAAKREWEDLDREASDAFEPLWNRRP